MKSIFISTLILSAILLQSCERTKCGCAPPMSSRLQGQWAWVKTVTPKRTVTPETAGFKKEVNFYNDGYADYVSFYQSDTLNSKLLRSKTGGDANERPAGL